MLRTRSTSFCKLLTFALIVGYFSAVSCSHGNIKNKVHFEGDQLVCVNGGVWKGDSTPCGISENGKGGLMDVVVSDCKDSEDGEPSSCKWHDSNWRYYYRIHVGIKNGHVKCDEGVCRFHYEAQFLKVEKDEEKEVQSTCIEKYDEKGVQNIDKQSTFMGKVIDVILNIVAFFILCLIAFIFLMILRCLASNPDIVLAVACGVALSCDNDDGGGGDCKW
tara:strand:+ start:1063 stop:1719 length:657 start_codon:yes stop_codon:yes gene_type:complete